MSSTDTQGAATADGAGADTRGPMRKVAAASLAGATLEWYDFQLYGWLSALAFSQLFFPETDPIVGTLLAFVSFGVGFAMRPLGAVFFGHVGDKLGRRSTLLITLLLAGVPTVLTGLLPTYQSIGIWAPVLLVLFRLIQGFGLGGEFGGAALMVVEHAPKRRRGFWGTWAGLGNPAGQFLSIVVVFAFVISLPHDEFLSWGWRVPYLLSVIILVAGMYVRFKVAETPAFEQMKDSGKRAKLPAKDLFRQYPLTILKALGARVADSGTWAVFLVFGISYATTQLDIPKSLTTVYVAVILVAQMIVIPLAGTLSDRIGRRPVIMIGAVVVGVAVFPSFALMNTTQPVLVGLAFLIGFPIGTGMIFAPSGAMLPELFNASVRFSGTSVVFQLSSLAAGFVPAIATSLLLLGDGDPWIVCGFVVLLAVATLLCAYLLPETSQRDLEPEPADNPVDKEKQ